MSVKGFKLKNGDIVRYDYSALDDIVIDDTLAVTGAAADAKATGDAIEDAIDNMESKIGDLSDLTTTDKTSAVDAINEVKNDISIINDNLGTYVQINWTSTSVPTSTYTIIDSKTLPAGKWIMVYGGEWTNNGNGFRLMTVNTDGTSNPTSSRLTITIDGSSAHSSSDTRTMIWEFQSETTFYLWGWQNSGATLNCWPVLTAIQLK